jgi:hypothetical protein
MNVGAQVRKQQCRDARFFAKKTSRAILRTESDSVTIFPGDFKCIKDKLHDAVQEIS